MVGWIEERIGAIAVIGAAGRFPKAGTLDELWRVLKTGRNCTETVSHDALRAHGVPDGDLEGADMVTAMGRLENVRLFDADIFGLAAYDAELMDPQQRKLLECSYEALESAGYLAGPLENRVAVYVAASHSSYLPSRLLGVSTSRVTESLQMAIANDRDYIATRISYLLNLTGPSLTVQTACSSSLTAIHLACQSLLSGESDMALAGGASITLPQEDGYRYREELILSKSGICRPFDAMADGTVNGNGAGMVLLKPLDAAVRDGDVIRAIIRGTAVNNDGFEKMGYTAPSVNGESSVIAEALAISGVDAAQIGFVSSHGTATDIGDPIEIDALSRAFDTSETEFCTIGAIKANIGHLDAAAGVAGFFAGMLALENRELPPIANFKTPNPRLKLEKSPFVIRTASAPWASENRFAMVNSFGFGGTNVSVVLEEAPQCAMTDNASQSLLILPLSARTPEALDALVGSWLGYIDSCPDMEAACWTAACCRRHYKHRAVFMAKNREDLQRQLAQWGGAASVPVTRTIAADRAILAVTSALLEHACAALGKVHARVKQWQQAKGLTNKDAFSQSVVNADFWADLSNDLGLTIAQDDTAGIDTVENFMGALGQYYINGSDVRWKELLQGYKVDIPSIPFSGKEYWHPLAERREALPANPAISSQASAAQLSETSAYILEPEKIPLREELLESMCAAAVVRAFGKLGFPKETTAAEAISAMGIPAQFSQLTERLLLALHERNLVSVDGGVFHSLVQVTDEEFEAVQKQTEPVWDVWGAMETMLLHTTWHLDALLLGQLDLRETFMPKGDLSSARRVYSEMPNSIYFNGLIREHVREWVGSAASGEAIRIFEIGGGTAATTERLLPLLPPLRATYMFTDVSPVFLRQAEARFAEYDFLHTAIFDMEVSPEEQGFEMGLYDIVVASNVLHAAVDLAAAVRHAASLLRPGGMLLMYEITRPNILGEITTGLLLPNIADTEVRGIQPMASDEVWRSVLEDAGFDHIQMLPGGDSQAAISPERVISASLKQDMAACVTAVPTNCTYRTVWHSKGTITPALRAETAHEVTLLLLADVSIQSIFQDAARMNRVALKIINPSIAASELQDILQESGPCAIIDARAITVTEEMLPSIALQDLCGGLLKLLGVVTVARVPDQLLKWVSVTHGAAHHIRNPQQASFWGMNRVVGMGHPELQLRQFDLAEVTEESVSVLFDLINKDSEERLNAIAGKEWLVPRLERCSVADMPRLAGQPQKEGWQVIVGGLGGIGLAVAADLTEQGFKRIALVSRHSPQANEADTIASLRQKGATVSVGQADVTDCAALETFVVHLRGQAEITGIYHCAVVKRVTDADENDPWPAFWQILAPKIQGAWNLHYLAQKHALPLDRMVFFSSSVSVVPPYSLPHYVAANAYLDALAAWRHAQGLPGLSISWGAWRDIGTVSDPAHAEHLRNGGLFSFSPAEGLALFNDLVTRDIGTVAAMRVDWAKIVRQHGQDVPAYFKKLLNQSPGLKKPLQKVTLGHESDQSASEGILAVLSRAGDEAMRLEILEGWLKDNFAKLLKVHSGSIDRSANLFDVGIDSLMFIEMSEDLEKALGIKISPSSLLQEFTIAKIAEKLLPDIALEGETRSHHLSSLFIPEPHRQYEPFPLTDVQRAYWVGRRQEMALGNTACQGYIEFDCHFLNIERLQAAWRSMIGRHATLRTVIGEDGLQRVLETVPDFAISVHDLTGYGKSEQQKALESMRDRLSHKVHDPAIWPLFDVEVSVLDADISRLHVIVDNIIMDGRSISILLAEWAALYHTPDLVLPERNISFRDYVMAVERYRTTAAYHEAEQYWDVEARNIPAAPQLPLAKEPEQVKKPQFVRHAYRMEPELWQTLKRVASKHEVTVSSLLMSSYAEVLALWSREPELCINAPVFTRLPFHPKINDVIGEFTSSILVRCDGRAVKPFVERVKAVQQRIFDGLKHCQVSGIEVMRRMIRDGLVSGRARMPVVFTSTFGLAKVTDGVFAASIDDFSSLGKEVYNISQTPQVWIDNHVHDRDGTLGIYWDAVEELFPAGLIDAMFKAYCNLLERLARDASAWLEFAPLGFGHQQVESPAFESTSDALLHAGFIRNVLERPHHTAVIDGDNVLTYAELFACAASLAQRLSSSLLHHDGNVAQQGEHAAEQGETRLYQDGRALQRGDNAPQLAETRPYQDEKILQQGKIPLIAVSLPRGWKQAVAVLAVLFSKAAYVPIDFDWPLLRRRAVLNEAQVTGVITLAGETLEDWGNVPLFSVEEGEGIEANPSTYLDNIPADLAYVIFTSGTTGTPKGVMMNHAGAMMTINEINRRFGITESDRVFSLSALSFDLSVYDFFGLWSVGGAVVFPQEKDVRMPAAWAEIMEKHKVTLWNSVPMFWQMLLESDIIPAHMPRLVLMSGDRIPAHLPRQSLERFRQTRLVSLGGATEGGIWSIYYEIGQSDPQAGWKTVPYGRALNGQSFSVLHEDLRECPIDVPGELYIGGGALALGYMNNTKTTQERFIVHPGTGERLYRTGDLGVRHACGEIEFLGRIDTQVKIGGYRVELGDIESTLMTMKAVAVGVVVFTKTGQLVAFVKPHNHAQEVTSGSIQHFLQERLPSYMIPSRILVLDQMPLSVNGKVDRQQLMHTFDTSCQAAKSTPHQISSSLESMLCDVWSTILEQPVQATDNIFVLGADSLAAVRAEALCKQRYSVKLPLQIVFDHPVVREMANALDEQTQSGVTTLRHADADTVLFCFGNVFSDGESFRDLARYWPLGALKAVSILPDPGEDFDAQLTRICQSISTAQPDGAIRLMGYCSGGIFAWSVARRLQECGRTVDRLALVSSMPLPADLHHNQEDMEKVTKAITGGVSPELVTNLREVCSVLEGVELPCLEHVPLVFVETEELSKDAGALDFWLSKTARLQSIESGSPHAACLQAKPVLKWLGQLIDWYETGRGPYDGK